MTTTTTPIKHDTTQQTSPATGSQPHTGAPGGRTGSTEAPRRSRRVTLFSVLFQSQMSDADLARLHSSLDLVTYLTPKPGVSGATPGVVRLDFWSGLFLERGRREGEWVLEARTWANPAVPVVHEWHVRAALAARELDPSVHIPVRHPTVPTSKSTRPVGLAATKWPARDERRLSHQTEAGRARASQPDRQ